MSAPGYIKLSRSVFEKFKRDKFSRRDALIWLRAEASWEDRGKEIDGANIRLKRGQLAHSVRFMAEAWKWPQTNVVRFLRDLKNSGEIESGTLSCANWSKSGTRNGTRLTVITICDYDCSQVALEKSGTPNGFSAEHERHKLEELKELKESIRANSQPVKEEKGNSRQEHSLTSSEVLFFEDFWKAKPSRGRASNPRHAALLKFVAAVKGGADPQQIIAAAKQWTGAEAENKTIGTQYVAMAATWLHQRRYEEYQAPAGSVAATQDFTAYPGSPEFEIWWEHYHAIGAAGMIRELVSRKEANRSFIFPSQWPPGQKMKVAQ
jgi:hypothetical protein